MLVFKFGGSSVANLDGVNKITEILSGFSQQKAIVISAFGKNDFSDKKLTEMLIGLYQIKQQISLNKNCRLQKLKNAVKKIVFAIDNYQNLLIKSTIKPIDIHLLSKFLIDNCNYDEILSVGEYCTAKIIACHLNKKFINATDIIRAENKGLSKEKSLLKIKEFISDGDFIVPGFYCGYKDKVRVLPRGGSDITGAFLANILNAEKYYNCSDVNGLLTYISAAKKTAKIKKPETIKSLSYGQLLHCVNQGAKVYSQSAVYFLAEKNITLKIKNTYDFSSSGTTITSAKNEFFIFSEIEKCLVFRKNIKMQKIQYLHNILNIFMSDITSISPLFYRYNDLILQANSNLKTYNYYKANLCDLLTLTLYGNKYDKSIKLIKSYAKGTTIKIKIRRLPRPFKKTIIYFYGNIDFKFIDAINKLLVGL